MTKQQTPKPYFNNVKITKKETTKSKEIVSVRFLASVVEWSKREYGDRHGLVSKTYSRHSVVSWERHFAALSPASRQAVLNYSHISIKLQADSNILASAEAGRGNCLPYVLVLRHFHASQGDKYRDKIKRRNI